MMTNKQIKDETPVFIHFFATANTELQPVNNGNVGLGNRACVNFEIAATLHRTRKSAEQCRRKTGGVIVPSTVAQLPVIFPEISGFCSKQEAHEYFTRAFNQEHIVTDLVIDSITRAPGKFKIESPEDDEWVRKIGNVIDIWD